MIADRRSLSRTLLPKRRIRSVETLHQINASRRTCGWPRLGAIGARVTTRHATKRDPPRPGDFHGTPDCGRIEGGPLPHRPEHRRRIRERTGGRSARGREAHDPPAEAKKRTIDKQSTRCWPDVSHKTVSGIPGAVRLAPVLRPESVLERSPADLHANPKQLAKERLEENNQANRSGLAVHDPRREARVATRAHRSTVTASQYCVLTKCCRPVR